MIDPGAELQKRIALIKDPEIKEFTKKVVDFVPQAAWLTNSSAKFHMKDERGALGNTIHTVRVVDIAILLAEATSYNMHLTDVLISAAILHDSVKKGLKGESSYTVKEHPYLVRQLVEDSGFECQYKEEILAIIEPHMGRWSPLGQDVRGNLPNGIRERMKPVCLYGQATPAALLHFADNIEAKLPKILPEYNLGD